MNAPKVWTPNSYSGATGYCWWMSIFFKYINNSYILFNILPYTCVLIRAVKIKPSVTVNCRYVPVYRWVIMFKILFRRFWENVDFLVRCYVFNFPFYFKLTIESNSQSVQGIKIGECNRRARDYRRNRQKKRRIGYQLLVQPECSGYRNRRV